MNERSSSIFNSTVYLFLNSKVFLSFACILSSFIASSQQFQFQVKFSRPYAIYEFVRNLSGNSPDNSYKRAFLKSRYNDSKYQQLITDFDSVEVMYWYEFSQYPYGNKIGGSTYFLLGKNLIESETIEEFETRSFGIIPNSDLQKLSKVLKAFQSVYNEVIYEPGRKKFNHQLYELRKIIRTTNVSEFFDRGKYFHKSTWDNNVPFVLCLYPKPEANDMNGTAFYNYSVFTLGDGIMDFNFLLCVMFHEAFHILYDEQSLSIKKKIAQWFILSEARESRYASLLFNEAITTSLTSGYLYREFTGSLLAKDWYNNKYINLMAREMFPLVDSYVRDRKQIDKEFVDQYVKIYHEKFSDWLNESDNLMTERFIVAENQNHFSTINKRFRYSHISEHRTHLNRLVIEEMKATPITKIVILESDKENRIELLKECFKELKDWQVDLKTDFVHTEFLCDKTYLIVLNPVTKSLYDLLNGNVMTK